MKEATIKVKNSTGLHARPAAIIAHSASKFKSNLSARKGTREINLKSLLALLSLGVCKDDEIIIKADGQDEAVALEAIISAINSLED